MSTLVQYAIIHITITTTLTTFIFFFVFISFSAQAFRNHPTKDDRPKTVTSRTVCAASTSQIDQNVNNVRARLLGGGDCWWDFSDGQYIVPNLSPIDIQSGRQPVSAIFAAAVWMGGFDASGVYLIVLDAYSLGKRTLKWFGVTKGMDLRGL